MNDKNGAKVTRGTRVMVSFPERGLSWTGRVIGPSRIDGRVKVQSEYVNWKGPMHAEPAMFARLADQKAPIHYEDEVSILTGGTTVFDGTKAYLTGGRRIAAKAVPA